MEMLLNKKQMFINHLKANNPLVCPICSGNLLIDNQSSLKCEHNHTFNINKKGYVRLLKKEKKFSSDLYSKQLFLNRKKVIPLYAQMHKIIASFINDNFDKKVNVFEVGSGESTHSFLIQSKLKNCNKYIVSDLSVSAVELSTDYLINGITPVLCDVYALPIKSEEMDCVIDILSPYSASEVKRILKKDGYFIKVFPGKNYLKEIRDIIKLGSYEKEEEVYNNFIKNFKLI